MWQEIDPTCVTFHLLNSDSEEIDDSMYSYDDSTLTVPEPGTYFYYWEIPGTPIKSEP